MFTHEVNIRVRYAETDQMGYVYYGHYAMYFEVARVETFRHLGISYRDMELSGTIMPVLEYKAKYIKPARYDDLLTIKLYIRKQPGVRILFEYEVYNASGVLLTIAETTLVFVDTNTNKPCMAPSQFEQLILNYFNRA
jgi:acyl-CoA thioester hydrolase